MTSETEIGGRIARLSPEARRRLLRRVGPPRLPAPDLVAEGLRQCGIQNLSGIPGTPVGAIFRAAAHAGIRIIGTRHQTSAAFMAATANYLSGDLQNAVLVSAGPAITHLTTALLCAKANHWPVVALGGRRSLGGAGRGYFQEMDAVPFMRHVTKHAATVERTADIIPALHEARRIALEGQPGPVYLDLPEDILAGDATPEVRPPFHRTPGEETRPEDAAACLDFLRSGRRQLLCVGEGIRWSWNAAALSALVERESLPFITTPGGRGLLPDTHPLCGNRARRTLIHEADRLLLAGAWCDWRFRFGADLNPQGRVCHVHADPDGLGRNLRDPLTFAVDPGLFLTRLNGCSANAPRPSSASDWPGSVRARSNAARDQTQARCEAASGTMSLWQAFDAVRPALSEEDIVVLDGSDALHVGQHVLEARRPLSWLDPGAMGCIGSGIPQALGAALAHPDRTTIAMVSDTSFGFSAMDLDTAVRHDLPIITLILNNGGINGIRRQNQLLDVPDAQPAFRFQTSTAYDGIARALNAAGDAITDPARIGPAIEAARRNRRPACLNLLVEPDADAPPNW